jgi:hypothetical protein
MKFKTLDGKDRVVKNLKKTLIKWDAKSRSKIQKNVKDFLKPFWLGDVVFEEMKVAGTRLSLDFYNANKRIAIEVQGEQHFKFIPFFHGNRNTYLKQIKRDVKKIEFCEINNITLVEIFPEDKLSVDFFKKMGVSL